MKTSIVTAGLFAAVLTNQAQRCLAADETAKAEANGPERPVRDVAQGTGSVLLKFSNVAPGASVSFPIPKAGVPIHISVVTLSTNGGVQTPSSIMYATICQDPGNYTLSWVGTNNDGSMQVGTTLPSGSSPVISAICGGSCPTVIDTLSVNSALSLQLTHSSATSIIPATYVVLMEY